jgi:DNA polymerase phi
MDTVTCSQILHLIDDSTRSQGSVSGQEERDSLFARLFGLTSLVQSGLLFRAPASPNQPEPATLSTFDKWLANLLAIAAKKSWLHESAGWTLLQAVSSLASAKVEWKGEAMSVVTQRLFLEDKVWTPEKVALLLRCQQDWPEFDSEVALSGSWKHGNILHSSNYTSLAKVLKV